MASEEELVERARGGSSEAFREIVRLHQSRVRVYLARCVRDLAAADDLGQEVFLTAFRSLGTYAGNVPLSHWLIGIARHRVLTHLRDEARRRSREAQGLWSALTAWRAERAGAGGADPERHERETKALKSCMDALEGDSAKILNEYYFARQTSATIARDLGRKETAVRKALERIRTALRRCIEQRMAAEGI